MTKSRRDGECETGTKCAAVKQGLAIARQYDQDQAYGSIGVQSHASNMKLFEAQAIWKL